MAVKIFLCLIAALLAACAPLPSKPGFEAVQSLVASRIPQTLEWHQTSAERDSHQQTIAAMIASPLTLDSALRLALTGNPDLQATYEKLGIAYGDFVQAGLAANPMLSLSFSSSAVGSGHQIGVVQDVLSLLAIAPRKRLATTMFDETKLQTEQRVSTLALEVKKAYFEAYAAEESLKLEQNATATAAVAAELAQRQFDAGNIGTRELALRQEFHARAMLRQSRQELAREESREHLSRLLGLPSGQREWSFALLPWSTGNEIPTLKLLEEDALKHRFDIAAWSKRIERLADALGVANRFRYLSALGLGVNFSRETDGEKLRGPSLSIGLPLWDRNQGARFRMAAELRESERQLEGLILNTHSEVRSAYARITNAQRALVHFETTLLPLHERIVAETLKFYNGMLLGVYDLLSAKQNQLDAKHDHIEMVKMYCLAQADLEHAIGGGTIGSTIDTQKSAPAPASQIETHKHHSKETP